MNKVEIKSLLLECISMWKNEDASEDWTDYEMIGLDKLEVLYKCFDFDPEWKDCNDAYRKNHSGVLPYQGANDWFEIMLKLEDGENPYPDGVFESDREFTTFRSYISEGTTVFLKLNWEKMSEEVLEAKRIRKHNDFLVKSKKSSKYTCQSCDLPVFTNSVSVWTNHIIKREHIESTNGDLSQLECEHCGEDFDTTIQLKKHAKTRKCEFYRTCSYCKETSGSKFTYEQHKGDGKCHVEKLVDKSKATI